MGQGRGRRGEKKEKSHRDDNEVDLDADFIPLDQEDDQTLYEDYSHDGAQLQGPVRDNRASFFGLLDRAELEYFKNAESVLATNALSASEREAFIDNLFDEAKGKELKLATNQVCSKLLERMTQLANTEQMQQLASAVAPFATDLAFQKFSSHCLEAIIVAAIPVKGTEESIASMTTKLGESAVDMAYDRYAAHVLSTLILSLSGLKRNLRSKKSQLARKHTEIDQSEGDKNLLAALDVPAPLRKGGCELVNKLIDAFQVVDARKLAIDPTGSSVVQAIIMAEASLMSGYRFIENILKDGSSFVSHCTSDSVGSHFLGTVLKVLPAKKSSKFIDTLPLATLATSENEASRRVVQSVIADSNLSKRRKVELLQKDLKSCLGHNVGLSTAALDVDFDTFAPIITEVIKENHGINLQEISRVRLHEKLADFGPFTEAAVDSVIAKEDKDIVAMATDATQSFVLQSLLKASTPLIARRKLINKIVALIPSFVSNAYGSHIVDSLWPACYKLKFVRERIASELLKLEASMKHSPYGRKVWKNWHMEMYMRRRHDWFTAVKNEEDELRQKLEPENVDRNQSAIAKAAAAAVAGNTNNNNKKRRLVH